MIEILLLGIVTAGIALLWLLQWMKMEDSPPPKKRSNRRIRSREIRKPVSREKLNEILRELDEHRREGQW